MSPSLFGERLAYQTSPHDVPVCYRVGACPSMGLRAAKRGSAQTCRQALGCAASRSPATSAVWEQRAPWCLASLQRAPLGLKCNRPGRRGRDRPSAPGFGESALDQPAGPSQRAVIAARATCSAFTSSPPILGRPERHRHWVLVTWRDVDQNRPGQDVVIVSVDAVRIAFKAMIAGKLN